MVWDAILSLDSCVLEDITEIFKKPGWERKAWEALVFSFKLLFQGPRGISLVLHLGLPSSLLLAVNENLGPWY